MLQEIILLLCSVLLAMVGFIGSRLFTRLDRIEEDLNSRFLGYDRRITRIEVQCKRCGTVNNC
jgi:hypothetical protein